MRRILVCLAMAFSVAFLAATMSVAQEQDETSETDPGSVTVATSESGAEYIPGELVVVNNDPKQDSTEVIPVEEQTLKSLKEKAKKVKASRFDAEIVEPNYVYRTTAQPNDYWYPQQYFFEQIGAPPAWNTTKGESIRICVIDTGWDRGNPEFSNKVVAEKDLVQNDSTAQDANGHGTHVAGIAAAETNNELRTAGVGWESKLVIAKAGSAEGNLTSANVEQALNFCQNAGGVSVINMSFGGPDTVSAGVQAEISQSYNSGINLVASSGNDGVQALFYPAAYPGVIGVGASQRDGNLATFSNRGSHVDLVAPGVDIRSAWIDESSRESSGTSMSSPQVAGGVALLAAKGLDRDQREYRLFQYAEDRGAAGKDPIWGHGFLNLRCATAPQSTGC